MPGHDPGFGVGARHMKLKAKNLILDLLLAARDLPLTARDAVAACGLFGIRENNVRVCLARLSAEGLIEAASRGHYRLSPKALRLGDEVAHWRSAEDRLRAWQGDFVAVRAVRPDRNDRSALRSQFRALEIMGFGALYKDFYLRPNNIESELAAVREHLYALGLHPESLIFGAGDFAPRMQQRIAELWDTAALNRRYREQRARLEAWLDRHADLEPEVAARESFLLGNEAVRQIVFDPLLPDDWIDVHARHDFFAAMRRFDDVGHAIWRGLFASSGGMPATAARGVRATH